METAEIEKLAALEERHWWYRERRAILRRSTRTLVPGRALDIGSAGGGNTRVLRDAGWSTVAVEYDDVGASIALSRELTVVRADGCVLPFPDGLFDLVVAFDVLEHIVDDRRAASEIHRVLRPGGIALIAVPSGMDLWSAHDEAVGHVRRYERDELRSLVEGSGLVIEDIRSWNVILRQVAKWRRSRATGSDLDDPAAPVNAALTAIIASERVLPLGSRDGVSLMVRARRRSPRVVG